jgi:hypothetical protein
MDTKGEKQAQITVVFKLDPEEYERAVPYIGGYKYRHYWAKNAFVEKVSRMEANDKKSRERRMKTDADYIKELIKKGLIHTGREK